jgi:hypothetical protein
MPKLNARLYLALTTLESTLLGIPIIQARSLGAGGYSLPRLILLVGWILLFGFCVWILVKDLTVFSKRFDRLSATPVRSNLSSIREWLIVLAILSWGGLALFFLKPDFLIFIWNSLPALFNQYWFAVLIVGIWSAQSLFALRFVKHESQKIEPQSAQSPQRKPSENLRALRVLCGEESLPKAIQIFLIAFFLYAETAVALKIAPYSTTAYFPELAQSFLSSRVDLVNPLATKDLTFFNGKYYVSFPPLGALLMLPIVAWHGAQEFNILLFNIFFASLGVTFMFLTLESMRLRGLSQLNWWGNAALALFLGFGTAQYSMTMRGLVNLTSQILTTTFLALALWLVLQTKDKFKTSALLAGSALALSMLARPNIVFAWFALAALKFHGEHFFTTHLPWRAVPGETTKDTEKNRLKISVDSVVRFLQWSLLSSIPIIVAGVGLLWYNQIRFGSPFDFGYSYMLVAQRLKDDLAIYGQFNPHFIFTNLRDNFLSLPYWDNTCQQLTFSPNGTSIFFTSPLLIYAIIKIIQSSTLAPRASAGVANHQFTNLPNTKYQFTNLPTTVSLWLSIVIIALLHLMYYNSGALQVGYRFSLDFMPLVVMLIATLFDKKISITALFLIAVSIFVNYFGVLWTLHRWCENF